MVGRQASWRVGGWVDGEKVLSIMHIIIRLRSFTGMNKTNHFFIFPPIVRDFPFFPPRRPFLCLLLMTSGQWLGSVAEDFSRLSSIFDDTTLNVQNMSCAEETSGSGVKNRQFEVLDINIISRHLSRAVSSVAGEIWRAPPSRNIFSAVCVCVRHTIVFHRFLLGDRLDK